MKNSKKIINEALGLDVLYNLKKDEKSALKFLHKKYKDVEYTFQLRTNELVDFVEDMGFNFTTSMKLATLYKNNRDQLFKEFHEKYYNISESEIVYNALEKFSYYKNNEDELTDLMRKRFKDSNLAKQFGYDRFYIAPWSHSNEISFYITYTKPDSGWRNTWKTIMSYNYRSLEDKVGSIDKIPFIVSMRGIEGDFPVPELEGSTDKIEIPITFDLDELNRNDIYNIILGKENSLFNDFDERMSEIMSIDN